MALGASTTNFLFFSANGDTTGAKRIVAAGILVVKTGAAVAGKVNVRDASSAYNIIPPAAFPSGAQPTVVEMRFPGGQVFPNGLKATTMSGCTMVVTLADRG